MLKISNLTKKYSGITVVDNISFELEKNTINGFIGHNGAGKSTTLKSIIGSIKYDSGLITYNGLQISLIKDKIGYLPEFPAFPDELNAIEFLSMVCKLTNTPKAKDEIKKILEIVNLKDQTKKRIKNYSKGMKQRLGIAQSIINKPELLILDEPFNGLDPIGMKEIRLVLEKLKPHTTILISSHLIFDLEKICDNFIIIKAGKIVGQTINKNLDIERYYESMMKGNK